MNYGPNHIYKSIVNCLKKFAIVHASDLVKPPRTKIVDFEFYSKDIFNSKKNVEILKSLHSKLITMIEKDVSEGDGQTCFDIVSSEWDLMDLVCEF